MHTIRKHFFWLVIHCSSLYMYVTRVTRDLVSLDISAAFDALEWTTVFCPVVCSLISALTELHWTGFSRISVADICSFS